MSPHDPGSDGAIEEFTAAVQMGCAALVDEAVPEDDEMLADVVRRAVLPGGKWLRSRLVRIGHDCREPAPPSTELVDLACAVELFHAFALVHDDIIDRSPARRGDPTAHARATEVHGASGWSGDGAGFGSAVALLAGDVLLAIAWSAQSRAAPGVRRVRDLWAEMVNNTVRGEALEVESAARQVVSRDVALRITDLKTGSYSFAQPLRLGAALAGAASEDDLDDHLRTIGLQIGRGFQLQDDLLDVYGSRSVTGKARGGDVVEARPTLFRAECVAALEARGDDRIEALARFGASPHAAAEIGVATGVAHRLREEVVHHLSGARARVQHDLPAGSARSDLTSLVDALLSRTEDLQI